MAVICTHHLNLDRCIQPILLIIILINLCNPSMHRICMFLMVIPHHPPVKVMNDSHRLWYLHMASTLNHYRAKKKLHSKNLPILKGSSETCFILRHLICHLPAIAHDHFHLGKVPPLLDTGLFKKFLSALY